MLMNNIFLMSKECNMKILIIEDEKLLAESL